MNAQETITAGIQKLEAVRLTPPQEWTTGPFTEATSAMRRTVEPQIAILRQALDLLTLGDDAVELELELAHAILGEEP